MFHSFPAPAKLNLFLHVVGRRDDGYHLLQTVFRFIDYGDTLHLRVRADGEICHLNPIPGVEVESDLVVRAARLLQQETGCQMGVDIRIDKCLPMGGGLGGGSSDAATMLLALNHLWQLHLPRERLQALGLTLGADVPVFVFGRNAFAEGIGEALQAVDLDCPWYLVAKPEVSVPTVEIFRDPGLTRDTKPLIMAAFPAALAAGQLKNDLQAIACKKYPAVAETLEILGRFGKSMMTGSGACVFAEFSTRQAAEDALAQLPKTLSGFVAQGLKQHPLLNLVD